MAVLTIPNPTILQGAITAQAKFIQLSSATFAQSLIPGSTLRIENEIVEVTTVPVGTDGGIWAIRGSGGTAAASHADLTPVTCIAIDAVAPTIPVVNGQFDIINTGSIIVTGNAIFEGTTFFNGPINGNPSFQSLNLSGDTDEPTFSLTGLGWGTGATVTFGSGSNRTRGDFSIVAGTTPAINPGLDIVFPTAFTSTPFVYVIPVGFPIGEAFFVDTVGTDNAGIAGIVRGLTPVNGSSYRFRYLCIQ